MGKLEWQRHWKEAGQHDTKTCAHCGRRRKTKQANARRKDHDDAMRSLGLVKVRVLGETLWE